MKIHKSIVLAIAVALTGTAITYTAPSYAITVFDPVNYVQNLETKLRAVQSNLNEVQQLQRQLEQLKYMAENTKALAGGDWDVSADTINRLASVLESGQSIALSGKNFESSFKSMFPGYKPDRNYHQQYDRWNQTTQDSVYSAMRAANMQMQGIGNEQQALASLRSAARSTTGQKQALDAANQIALAQIDQLQQLRELMVSQTQIAGSQAAAAAAAEQARRGQVNEVLQYKQTAPKPSGYKACAVPPCA